MPPPALKSFHGGDVFCQWMNDDDDKLDGSIDEHGDQWIMHDDDDDDDIICIT